MAHNDTDQATTAGAAPSAPARRGKLSLSRRQFWRVVVTAVAVASVPTVRQIVRRRRRGEPGPTGWFGHC